MIPSPIQTIHAHIGAPAGEGCGPLPDRSVCWQCGGPAARGARTTDWAKGSYTSQPRARASTSPVICEACVYCCSWTAVPGRVPKEGQTENRPPTWRQFSHFVEVQPAGLEARYESAHKGEKPTMRQLLSQPHACRWACAISYGGQKHTLPFTRWNPAGSVGGWVSLDDADIVVPATAGRDLDALCALLTAGATKEDIETGNYGAGAYQRCRDQIAAFERVQGRERGRAWFTLALFLAQRDEAVVQARLADEAAAREAAKYGGVGRRRDPAGAPGSDVGLARPGEAAGAVAGAQRPGAVHADRDPGAAGGGEREHGGGGHEPDPPAADAGGRQGGCAVQLSLF